MPTIGIELDWTRLDLNAGRLNEDWTREDTRVDFKDWLASLPRATLADICHRHDLPILGDDQKVDLTRKVMEAFDLRHLFFLKSFYRGKALAIKDYVNSSDAPICAELGERQVSPFAVLLCLAEESVEHLVGIEIFARWINYPAGTKYCAEQDIDTTHLDLIDESLVPLNTSLALRSQESRWTASVDRTYRIGSVVLIGIERQVGDHHIREVEGRRRSRPMTVGMVRLGLGQNEVEIRNCGTFTDSVAHWLPSVVGPVTLSSPGTFDLIST